MSDLLPRALAASERLKELDAKATPGAWIIDAKERGVILTERDADGSYRYIAEITVNGTTETDEEFANAAYAAASRTGWPAHDALLLECVEEIKRLQAELDSAREWQPIETAPKDGTWILGWAQSDSIPYRISWGKNHRDVLAWCSAGGSFVPGYITDWQPLPASPVRAKYPERKG